MQPVLTMDAFYAVMACMRAPLHEQLRRAWERSDLTLDELVDRAQLECCADSLSRKLRGKQTMSTLEAEALAMAMKERVVAGPRKKRAA